MNSYTLFINDILPKLNTFNDFYAINNYTKKQIGDFFEIITRYIFLIHYYYKPIIKNIWLYDEIPFYLFDEFNIPKKDKGIDLILLTNDNKYYAIQSKFRNNKYSKITWESLATFVGMTFGISNKFDGAFYVTNTVDIDEEVNKCNKIIKIHNDFFDTLDNNFFDQMRSLVQAKNINIYKPHIKRDYQVEFINKCNDHYKNENNGYGNIACGVGKTLMSYWLYKELKPKFTLIGVPSLYLLSQFYKEWSYELNADNYKSDILLIGSDADVGEDGYKNNGLMLTTNDEEIYAKLIEYKYGNNKNNVIIITTYQSADKLLFASDVLKIQYDLGIIDEAHKTCQQLGHQFSFLLNNKNIKINKRLFLTATPRIYKNVGDVGENVVAMNNETIFGKEIYKYSVRQGIDNKYLCNYQILTLLTDNKFISEFIEQNKLIEWDELKEIDSYYLATALMIIKGFQEHDCNHLVTYHNSIANSKDLVTILNNLIEKLKLEIKVFQIDGGCSIKIRNKIINAFKESKYSILTTARVFNEGVNIPIIDSECFVDARESTIDIIQCIGRSLRPYKDKTLAKILVPYFFEDINAIDEKFYFPKLVNIIKALSESDEVMKEYFIAKANGKQINHQIIKHCNYLSNETKIIINEKINLDEWIGNIDIAVWKRVDTFKYHYDKLKEHVDIYNEIPSVRSKNEEVATLGRWTVRMRQLEKRGLLGKEKIEQLNNIKGWYWSPKETKKFQTFGEKYNDIKKCVGGNKGIPSSYSDNNEESRVARICTKLRTRYKQNKLSIEQIQLLEKIDGWFWEKETRKKTIDENIIELKDFINDNGRMPYRTTNDPAEQRLSEWVERIKASKKKNKLSAETIAKFDDIKLWKWVTYSNKNK
jgi:predicted helicase